MTCTRGTSNGNQRGSSYSRARRRAIKPGVQGGTYRRENIRPACGTCNSETGGALASRKTRKKATR